MAYKMTHPQSKNEIEVRADMVAMYKSQGWETAPDREPARRCGREEEVAPTIAARAGTSPAV